jgi:hypothetical protein
LLDWLASTDHATLVFVAVLAVASFVAVAAFASPVYPRLCRSCGGYFRGTSDRHRCRACTKADLPMRL